MRIDFRRLWAARILGAAVALALGVFGWAASARAASLPAGFFGVNAWALFDAPASQWPTQLNGMQKGGINFVRSDAAWSVAEPSAPAGGVHAYDWTHFDEIVTALAQHQLRWYPIIDYSAPWAASVPGNDYSPPADNATYAAYAGSLARRYGAHGDFWLAHPELPYLPVEQWEIWNEENGGYFWQPGPDPGRYIDLYLAARSAIRAVDPQARAVIGGLADVGDTNQFIYDMYLHRPDAHGQVDAIGYHPYPLDGAQSAASSMLMIANMRTYLDWLGEQSVPLEVTEVGWTTHGAGNVSDAVRAQQLTELINDLANSTQGVSEFIPYAWVTGSADNQSGDAYGMFNWDGSPTLEGSAYLQTITALTAQAPTPQVPSPPTPTTLTPPPANGDSVDSRLLDAHASGVTPFKLGLSRPRLASGGLVRITVSCPRSVRACTGILRATASAQRRSRLRAAPGRHRLRAVRFSVAGGAKLTVRVRLPASLWRLRRQAKFRISVLADDWTAPPGARRGWRITSVI